MTRKILLFAALIAALPAFAAPNSGATPADIQACGTDTLSEPNRNRVEIDLTLELMSSYVCRGSYQSGCSFQPTLEASWRGIFLKAWGSTDLDGIRMREVDLTLGYRIQRFEAAVTDYYVTPADGGGFFTAGDRGPHIFEASVAWTVSERVPLRLWWGTIFAGADVANDGSRNFSSYLHLSYPFTVRRCVDMKAGIGMMPWSTENCFNTRGFAVTNVYLNASKEWTLRNDMKLGLLTQIICNPYRESLNFVGGISFRI